jgi:hypothetical protein
MKIRATSTQNLQLERLVPTENAAWYHIYRAHLQVIQWKLLSTEVMNPQEWGWQLHEGEYIPIANDIGIAPPDILKDACCKCSAGSKKQCGTRACLCLKYGLSCVPACKNCNGASYENTKQFVLGEDDLVDDDLAESAEVFEVSDSIDEYLFDDVMECIIPWFAEEEVVTSM